MATYEDRLASFEPRKIKFTKKSALNVHLARGWPHPSTATPSSAAYRATPSSLAHAGFYFDPTAEKDDNVTCFMCEHSLGEWTENDDPFVEHLNVDPKCPWALARCSIELDRQRDGSFIFTLAARLPTSKSLEKARADTFKGSWIHDQTKGHTANSRKMAKAGWIFNGGSADDSDIATCFYCGKSLDGWEMGDDPTKEHKNRVPNCPVFTAKLTAEPPSPPTPVIPIEPTSAPPTSNRPPLSTASTNKTRTTAKRAGKNQTTVIDVSDAAGTESDAPSQAKRGRPKKSVASKPKGEREESVQPTSQPETNSKKTTRSASISRKQRVETPDATEESNHEPVPTAADKPKRGKGKKAEKVIVLTDTETEPASVREEEDSTIKVPPKKKGTKKKSTKKAKSNRAASVTSQEPDDVMEMDEPASEVGIEEEVPPAPPRSATEADSLGGWESMEAANLELEEMAKELDIEGEFKAIGRKPELFTKSKPERVATGSRTTKEASKKSAVSKKTSSKEEKRLPNDDHWAWREKSVETRSVVTELETVFTEEEEVEKSLAGDEDEEEEENIVPSPPPSRGPSAAPSRDPSTTVSTTVSSKTKAKIQEVKKAKGPEGVAQKMLKVAEMWREDEEMADMPTPKAKRIVPTSNSRVQPAAMDGARTATSTSTSSRLPTAGFNTSMNTQLEAPTISADVNSYLLTEEEREMTLEEWIRFDVERRKEEIRIEGRKWIEGFLENAEATRDKIRML